MSDVCALLGLQHVFALLVDKNCCLKISLNIELENGANRKKTSELFIF